MTDNIINALIAGSAPLTSTTSGVVTEEAFFCAEVPLPSSFFTASVNGVGKLALPLTGSTIQKLLALSSAAQFGQREQTLLNKAVRDTQEIAADRLQISLDEFGLAAMLEMAAQTMGLPKSVRLVPHLHNMLIYGPGQFFKTHQDSEKLKGMVATLVIVLPSPHIGGTLVIEHNDEEYHFETENLDEQNLRCVVFYADCEHEIRPVKQGYRVSLTYNLVLTANQSAADQCDHAQPNLALEAALLEYFQDEDEDDDESARPISNTALLQSASKSVRPPRLAFFLDHRYTEHGLRWDLLKGTDHNHGQAFLLAAQRLGLVPHLALAEIHETWTADGDEDDPEPNELIDSETTLSYWVDAANTILNRQQCDFNDDETCWLTDLDQDEFFNSEYEGWTGNAGQTIDYWYRRGAIVLWPKAADVHMHFSLNYGQALGDLLKLCHTPGNQAEVSETIRLAGSSLHQFPWDETIGGYVRSLAQVAQYVNNEDTARLCLQPFGIADVDEDLADALLALQKTWGIDWCMSLLAVWQANGQPHRRHDNAPANINHLVRKLLADTPERDASTTLGNFLTQCHLDMMLIADQLGMLSSPVDRMGNVTRRMEVMLNLMLAAAALHHDEIAAKLTQHGMAHGQLYDPLDLAKVISALEQSGESTAFAAFAALRQYVTDHLTRELAHGPRASDDWAMVAQAPCECDYCAPVVAFVRSQTRSQDMWGLAEKNRKHVQRKLESLGLPLEFTVISKGSPYKLQVRKLPQLHQDARARFDKVMETGGRLGIALPCN